MWLVRALVGVTYLFSWFLIVYGGNFCSGVFVVRTLDSPPHQVKRRLEQPDASQGFILVRERSTLALLSVGIFSQPDQPAIPPPLNLPTSDAIPRDSADFLPRQDGFPRNLAQAAWLESVRDVITAAKVSSSLRSVLEKN